MKPELIISESFEDIMAAIYEPIAVKGLSILKKLLDDSGFADSEYLKDYMVFAHVDSDRVVFEIEIESDAISEDSSVDKDTRPYNRPDTASKDQKKTSSVQSKSQAKDYVKSYFIGKNNRPERISGRYDARKMLLDRRKMPRDARRISEDRSRTDTRKSSGQRYVEHEVEATAPRGLEVIDKKLRVTVQRTIRNAKKSQIHPKGDYQGIMSRFVDEINEIIADEFVPAITGILEE